MKKNNTNQLISGKAFQVFLTELEKHLNTFETLINDEVVNDGLQLDRASLTKLSASFHTIRGGSGFFGLDEIAKEAEKLEELFSKENFDLESDIKTAKELFFKLKSHASELTKE